MENVGGGGFTDMSWRALLMAACCCNCLTMAALGSASIVVVVGKMKENPMSS